MILTWPDFPIGAVRWYMQHQQAVYASQFGKQAITTAAPLWKVHITGLTEDRDLARRIGLFFDKIKGYVNQVALYNIEHPEPAGTMRGDMRLYVAANQGDTSITLRSAGNAGNTLLSGDYLGLGNLVTQQVVQITDDAAADNNSVITVNLNTPLRNSFSAGDPVTWDRPKALFRLAELPEGIEFTPSYANPWSVVLIEDWRP